MKTLSLKEFYAQSLQLMVPWKAVDVMIDGEARQVRIRVDCARGEVWGDPGNQPAGGNQRLGGADLAASEFLPV